MSLIFLPGLRRVFPFILLDSSYLTAKFPPSVLRHCWFGLKTCKKPSSILPHLYPPVYDFSVSLFLSVSALMNQPRSRSRKSFHISGF